MASLNTIGGLHYEMMKRCYNEKSVAFKDYGAKGIGVCPEWHDREVFRKWCKENGYIKGMRLERIDCSKGYEPSNCRFGTRMKRDKNSGSQKTKAIRTHRLEMKEYSGVPDNYSSTRLFRIFVGMHTRCENKNSTHYKDYGGRGISVCKEWSGKDGFFNFYKWSMDNGYADNLSIDRIEVNGNYEPSNCRWATMGEQMSNRRCSLNYNYNGSIYSLSEICKMEGLKYSLVYSRIKKGFSLQDAINDVKMR